MNQLFEKSFVFLFSFVVSYIIQNLQLHSINIDLHYILISSIIELVVVFTLFMIFVVNSRFVVPVMRTLVGICELCFRGVMGQVLYVLDIILLYSGFLYLFSMLDSKGFTLENFLNFFISPPTSFQLGCILLFIETIVVLVGVLLVKRFPDLVYAAIPRHKIKSVGMNPSGLQMLQKAAQIGGLAVGGALVANTLNSAVSAYTANTALESNSEIVRQASDSLEKGKINGSQYAEITSSTAQSNAAIAKKSSTISFKN